MGRIIKSVSLQKEHDDIIEKNIPDFSAYVQNCIERDFMNQEQIVKKIKEYENAITELKKLKIQTKTTEDEDKFLAGAKKRVQNSPEEVIENCRVYNLKFGKKVSTTKFKELIDG